MLKVLIADDHEIVRQGLSLFLQAAEGFVLVGAAEDGAAAIELAEKERPDLVLVDIKMPKKDGIEAAVEIKKRLPYVKVIVFTAFEDEEEVQRAIEAEVEGYVIKNISAEELLEIMKKVCAGQVYLHPEVASKLMSAAKLEEEEAVAVPAESPLTPREELVLKLMAQGYKNKDIAAKLFLSEETVKTHVSSILNKLNQTDRLQAVLYALKHQLIALDTVEPEKSHPLT